MNDGRWRKTKKEAGTVWRAQRKVDEMTRNERDAKEK